MEIIKKIIGYIGLFLLAALILSGPVCLILFILIKANVYLDLALIYLVVAVTAYYLNGLAEWADSRGKKK